VEKIQEFRKNPDRKVHRHIGVCGAEFHDIATHEIQKSEIDIGIQEFRVCVDMRFFASRVLNS
jgi:hypothetical protein